MLACFIFNSWLLFFFIMISLVQHRRAPKARLVCLYSATCVIRACLWLNLCLFTRSSPSLPPFPFTHTYIHTHKIPLKMSIVFSQYSYPLNTHSRPGTICGPPQPAPPNLHPQVSLTCGDVLFRYGSHFQHEILFLNLKLQIKNFLKL